MYTRHILTYDIRDEWARVEWTSVSVPSINKSLPDSKSTIFNSWRRATSRNVLLLTLTKKNLIHVKYTLNDLSRLLSSVNDCNRQLGGFNSISSSHYARMHNTILRSRVSVGVETINVHLAFDSWPWTSHGDDVVESNRSSVWFYRQQTLIIK